MMFFGVSQSLTPAILILDRGALKCAFLCFEVEPIFSEHIQDSGYDLPMVFNCASVYQDIVHIDCHVSFINEVLKDVVHHGLEGGRAVGEAEEHDQGFKEAPIRSEGSFPLVSLLDSYIVVSPTYVQFHEVSGLGVRNPVDNVQYKGQRVGVLHHHCIELSVVLDKS